MGSDSIPLWIIFVICVIGGAYFAATESAFSAVNKIKIKSMADDGQKSALIKLEDTEGILVVLTFFTGIGFARIFKHRFCPAFLFG